LGGQSLNVWDSVYKPDFEAQYFPPSAVFDSGSYPETYSHENIKNCFQALLKCTFENRFPKSPPIKMSPEDVGFIQSINPWTYRVEGVHGFDKTSGGGSDCAKRQVAPSL
jgi:hypothetical protein